MAESLEPEKVELSDVRVWLRESVALMRRKYWLYVPFSLLFFYVAFKLQMANYLTFFAALILCQAVLAITIEIASACDHSQPVSAIRCYQAVLNSVVTVLLLSMFYVLMWIVAARVAEFLFVDDVLGIETGPPAISYLQWLYPGTISLFIVYIGIMITTMWFLLPLTVFHKLGMLDTMKLAKRGEQKNFVVVVVASYVPFSVFFLLFMVSELALIVAIGGLPLFGIYMYVSYRHVYLGRRDNVPVPARQQQAAPAASGG
jgi:hypothetical protein